MYDLGYTIATFKFVNFKIKLVESPARFAAARIIMQGPPSRVEDPSCQLYYTEIQISRVGCGKF